MSKQRLQVTLSVLYCLFFLSAFIPAGQQFQVWTYFIGLLFLVADLLVDDHYPTKRVHAHEYQQKYGVRQGFQR